MKKYILLFSLLVLGSSPITKGEKIVCGTFKTIEKIKIKIFEPIYGYYNMFFYEKSNLNNCIINDIDSFYYKTETFEHQTLVVYITTANDIFIERSILTIFSGDSIHLVINLNEDDPIITYSGNNALGHKLFNDINKNPSSKYMGILNSLEKLNISKINFLADVENNVQMYARQFNKLFKSNNITKDFYDYEVVTFRQLLYQDIIDKLLNNFKKRERFTKKERDEITMHFFKLLPITNKYLKSSFISNLYINQYFNFLSYLKLNLKSLEFLFRDNIFTVNKKKFLIKNFCSQYQYITNSRYKEDLWAIDLLSKIVIGSPEPINETIIQYKAIFPNSKWIRVLDKQTKDFKRLNNIVYSSTIPINFFDSSKKYQTLQMLLNEMPKNKAVFIDIWATWCGPCILAFQYNKKIDSFLLTKNINRLYISLDKEANTTNWAKAINKYYLGGYNFIANENLILDVKKIIGQPFNGNISIPRYMLIDKNKKIVLNNASSPIDYITLTNEIEKFIYD